jgi:hypothetical protein
MKKLNEKGAALPMVLVTLAVVMVFSTSIISFSTSEGLLSIKHEQETEAYYLARSAVDAIATELEDNSSSLFSVVEGLSPGESLSGINKQNLLDGEIDVVITKTSINEVIIEATGYLSDNNAHIALSLEKEEATADSIFNHAVFSQSSINLSTFNKINKIQGALGSNGAIDFYQANGSGKITGNKLATFVDQKGNEFDFENINDSIAYEIDGVTYYLEFSDITNSDELSGNFIDEDPLVSYPVLSSTDIPSADLSNESSTPGTKNGSPQYTISKSGIYDLDYSSGSTKYLIFDTSTEDLIVVAQGDINFKQAVIEVTGTNTVTIYVNGDVTLSSTTFTNKPDLIRIIMTGSHDLKFQGNSTMNAFVYASGCTTTVQGGGTLVLEGSIITNSLSTAGNMSIKYVQPEADTPINGLSSGSYESTSYSD